MRSPFTEILPIRRGVSILMRGVAANRGVAAEMAAAWARRNWGGVAALSRRRGRAAPGSPAASVFGPVSRPLGSGSAALHFSICGTL